MDSVSDTVELFNKDDIRVLNRKKYEEKYRRYYSIFLIVLTCLFLLTLFSLLVIYKSVFVKNHDEQLLALKQIDTHHKHHNHIAIITTDKPIETTKQSQSAKCDLIANEDKFDCNPDDPVSQQECLSRGCCWSPVSPDESSTSSKSEQPNLSDVKPPLGIPSCYYPSNYVGYKVTDIDKQLFRTIVTLTRASNSGFRNDSKIVKVEIIMLNDFSIRIKLIDPSVRRFEVPIPKLNIDVWPVLNALYNISISYDGQLIVTRRRTGTVIFKSNLQRLVYSDQFLQISSELPSAYVYGIGEHFATFRKEANWKRYTLFNRDQAPIANMNLYGSHPFYMTVENDEGESDGVFLLNSNAMDIVLQPKPAITWRTIGGILDFFIFLGPKPDQVIRQYVNLVGLPLMPPLWGLGFHLCRFGYDNMTNLRATFDRMREAKIPYDVQWTDIDAMHKQNDFSYDEVNFKGLPDFVDHLHSIGMKYIPMVDCGIDAGEKAGTYPPYDEGVKLDIFVKNSTGQIFKGKVWNPIATVWPDFTNPKSILYWTRQLYRFHKIIAFDGTWLDMNDPSNFLNGSLYGCPNTDIESPQYVPGGGNDILRDKTLCMSAKHFSGLHYNTHNLYGTSETIVTNIALKTILHKRPFIISRSTFPGHGHFGSHWSGDVISDWESMRWTIPSILNFNLFGIPLNGADICGFNGNTTVELCARWSQLGAFYPFSRNHNSNNQIAQDPPSLGGTVVAAAKNALNMRYSLLSYLYTLFYKAHSFGDTVARALFFEFPKDKTVYQIETQFLWGPAVMIVPALRPNVTQVKAYLPSAQWYDLITYDRLESNGKFVDLDSPLDKINVLVRGGYVVPTQTPQVTTAETRKGNFQLIVALDENMKAKGELYWDDGDSLDSLLIGEFCLIEIISQNRTLISNPLFYGFSQMPNLGTIDILGVENPPKSVKVNGMDAKSFSYNQKSKFISLTNIGLSLSKRIEVVWQ